MSEQSSAFSVQHSALAVGVEIGGTKLQAALGTRDGQILRTDAEPARPADGAEGIRAQIESLVGRLLSEPAAGSLQEVATGEPHSSLSAQRSASGIGVGFGGPVDSASGTVLASHQVSGWEGFPLRQWFEERFGLPCVVENDSNAAGWAEFCCGAGRGTKNMIYMNIGSGIGGAIIVNGALYNGQGRGAGEIGHTYVPNLWHTQSAPSAQRSALGTQHSTPGTPLFDKLENLCSAWAIERRFKQLDRIPPKTPLEELTEGRSYRINGAIIAEAAARGDRLVLGMLDNIADMLGLAVANVLTLFHPERLVVGGGFAQMDAPLFDRLRASVERYVFAPFRGRYEIVPAELKQDVVLVGALLLAPHA